MTMSDSTTEVLANHNVYPLREARFSPAGRHVTRLLRTGNTEFFVVGWEQGQQSSVHGHDGFESTVIVLAGVVKIWDSSGQTVTLEAGSLSFTPPGCQHKIVNDGAGRAVTLHLYSPPTIGSMPEPFTDLLSP